MAASERMQKRRKQCIFRLAFQHCPLRKLARKLRGNNTYNMPVEPPEHFPDHWRSFNTVSGNLPPHERSMFNHLGTGPANSLGQASIQTLAQGRQPPAFPLCQVQVELNREPSMDMEVDPETGEHAHS